MRRTVLAAVFAVGGGLLAFALADQLPPTTHTLTFADTGDPSAFTTISGVPFPVADGTITITEPLAHLRLPFGHSVLGKRLLLDARFRLEEADVFAIGVKKGDFWLDYDRHVLLDRSAETATFSESEWIARGTVFDLNRAYLDAQGSLELMVFLKPEDGQRTLTLDELRIRIVPGPIHLRVLAERARLQVSRLLHRSPVPSPQPI